MPRKPHNFWGPFAGPSRQMVAATWFREVDPRRVVPGDAEAVRVAAIIAA